MVKKNWVESNRPFARSGHMVQNHSCWHGGQVAQRNFQNNVTRTSPPGPVFVLKVLLRNLLTSMCDFVPCDRILQRAYSVCYRTCDNKIGRSRNFSCGTPRVTPRGQDSAILPARVADHSAGFGWSCPIRPAHGVSHIQEIITCHILQLIYLIRRFFV